MKLAYRFLVFCRDFLAWKVLKIKGRGGRRHIGGVVVCGSLKGLKTQTLSGRLVSGNDQKKQILGQPKLKVQVSYNHSHSYTPGFQHLMPLRKSLQQSGFDLVEAMRRRLAGLAARLAHGDPAERPVGITSRTNDTVRLLWIAE
jgi:hypothetical protein